MAISNQAVKKIKDIASKKIPVDPKIYTNASKAFEAERARNSNLNLLTRHVDYLDGEFVKTRDRIKSAAMKGDHEGVRKEMERAKACLEEMNDYVEKNKAFIPSETQREWFMHDFRNKMTPLIGRAGMFTENPGMIAKEKGMIKPSKEHHDKLKNTVPAIKIIKENLSSIAESAPHSDFDLKEALEGFTPYLYGSGAKVKISVDSKMPLHGDKNALIRAVDNLITNSTQHMEKEGKIIVKAKINERGEPVITVENEHSFIPEENVKRIMKGEKFTTKKGGTGIGLKDVRNILNQHNGNMLVESSPEKGSKPAVTKFSLVLGKQTRINK